ncbi:hypothetical protein [Pseudohalioglobus lutimaris]|nr:hypothetical protein [Pseudohalioglobus lutimaris]
MLRVMTVLVLLATSALVHAVENSYAFMELRKELSTARTAQQKQAIVERMREGLRAGMVPSGHIGALIHGFAQQQMLNEPFTVSFMLELIATPGTAEAATTAIAGKLGGSDFNGLASKTFAEALGNYHRQAGLSDQAISNLLRAFQLSTPLKNREYALEILLLRPMEGDNRSDFLVAVASLLDPDMPVSERQAAMHVLVDAAKTGPLPPRAKAAIYRVATEERDAALRVTSWPPLMRERFENRGSARSDYQVLGVRLSAQLIAPAADLTPSFTDADEASRERAVALLNDYWHPEYSPGYIDILIELVDRHGSPASMSKLLELRKINVLSSEQVIALSGIVPESPAMQQSLRAVTAPNLAPGSLVGPVEVIGNSDDRGEWPQAADKLLAEYPEGTVPRDVAEAAYTVMAGLAEYNASAVSLFSRGDEPFAAREAKLLKLVDRSPRYAPNIVRALQHLHGDVGLEFLVRRYINDESIDESFRLTLLGMLHVEVRDSGRMDPETTASVTDFARSADSGFSVARASSLLEVSGEDVPWSIRIRHPDFQWRGLTFIGSLSLVVGTAVAVYLLVLLSLPGRVSGLGGAQRVTGFLLWLILSALFTGAVVLAMAHSIGHDSMPSPDRAAAYYAATLSIVVVLVILTIVLYRRRSSPGDQVSTKPGVTQ